MKLYYLEVVTNDVEATCACYETMHSVNFGEPDAFLGGARTSTLPDGSIIGVRAPLRDDEAPVVRPYWLTENIEDAVEQAEASAATIALPPVEIPGKGKIAIYILAGNDHGLWQL